MPHKNLPLAIFVALLSASVTTWADDGASLPADLGKSCFKRQPNAEKYQEALKGKNGQSPAQACAEQSKQSYNACKADPNETPAVTLGDGLRGSPEALKAAAQQGAVRNGEKASTCKEEREKTAKVCKELEDQLDQAITDNKHQRDEALAGADPAQTAAIQKQYDDVEKQLHDQKTATHDVNGTSTVAMADYQKCWTDEAVRADWVANQSSLTSASAASDSVKFTGDASGGDEGAKGATKSYLRDKLSSVMSDKGAGNIASTTGEISATTAEETGAAAVDGGGNAIQNLAGEAVAGGKGRVASGMLSFTTNVATGDGLGAVGSLGEMSTGFVKAIPGTLSSVGWGAVGFYFGSTNPAMGACDQPITDGIAADAAGCAQAGQLATQALNGD